MQNPKMEALPRHPGSKGRCHNSQTQMPQMVRTETVKLAKAKHTQAKLRKHSEDTQMHYFEVRPVRSELQRTRTHMV